MGTTSEKERQVPSMGQSGSKATPDVEIFYGVHIPNCSEDDFLHVYDKRAEALQVVKHHKKARFKAFKSRSDAVVFAVHGSECNAVSCDEGSASASVSTQSDAEKPSLFKGPKAQDMVQLRRAIESGNIRLVSKTIWDNPRFLISSGDTPTILQEGSRYNALHVAAKSKNAAITELVLQTISNPAFTRLLYGEDSSLAGELGTAAERSTILLDLYLNTPDKGMHETPLHFASKFGAVQVVATLVSYSECDREPKNKFGQRPIDIVCARCPTASEDVKLEITSLLQNEYYVPVLRAEDNSLPPSVGTPFSPKNPPVLKEDPLSPRFEIHAFAGPMSQTHASEFHRLWRTPPRLPHKSSNRSQDGAKSCPPIIRLKDPQKGLERIGRELATRQNVPWKEYWPFLDTFIDLSSAEGLALLEEYIAKRYQSVANLQSSHDHNEEFTGSNAANDSEQVLKVDNSLNETDVEPEILSPVTQLCSLMKVCTILDDSVGSGQGKGSPSVNSQSPSPASSNGSILSSSARFFDWLSRKRPEAEKPVSDASQNEAILSALSQPSLSPFLYVEKSLQLFAKRIAASLHHIVSGSTTHHLNDSIREVLKPEVKRVQNLVSSFMEDARFVTVDYHLVHSRIASSVAERLVAQLTCEERELFYKSLQDMLSAKGHHDVSSDDDEVVPSNTPYRQPRASRQPNSSNQRAAIHCIVSQMVWALDQLPGSGPDGRSPIPPRPQVRTENECLEMWSDAYPCLCPWPAHSQTNFARGSRKTSSMKRAINSSLPVDAPIPRRLDYSDKGDFVNERNEGTSNSGENLVSDDDDEVFFTPPSSPKGKSPSPVESDSENDEMDVPEEGSAVFIEGNQPSRVDADVMNAISTCSITQTSHPYIYRWRHEVLLHSLEDRERWQIRKAEYIPMTPSSLQNKPTYVSTPVSVPAVEMPTTPSWSRVTGPYSPLRCRTNKTFVS